MVTPYTVYCDASGHSQEGEILFVSGYGSTTFKWLRFERQWNALLQRYQIQPPFHMKEFAPGVGQYESWKHDQEKRKRFLTEAISIIKTNTNKSFSVGVSVNDLHRMQREYDLPDGINQDTPYTWCAVLIYHQVKAWLQRHDGPRDPIELVFEHGDKDQGHFLTRVRRLYPTLNDPIIRKKSECVPFQAADMLAWEHRRHVLHGEVRVRGSYAKLRKQIPHDRSWMYYDWEQLSHLCEKRPFPKRADGIPGIALSRNKPSG